MTPVSFSASISADFESSAVENLPTSLTLSVFSSESSSVVEGSQTGLTSSSKEEEITSYFSSNFPHSVTVEPKSETLNSSVIENLSVSAKNTSSLQYSSSMSHSEANGIFHTETSDDSSVTTSYALKTVSLDNVLTTVLHKSGTVEPSNPHDSSNLPHSEATRMSHGAETSVRELVTNSNNPTTVELVSRDGTYSSVQTNYQTTTEMFKSDVIENLSSPVTFMNPKEGTEFNSATIKGVSYSQYSNSLQASEATDSVFLRGLSTNSMAEITSSPNYDSNVSHSEVTQDGVLLTKSTSLLANFVTENSSVATEHEIELSSVTVEEASRSHGSSGSGPYSEATSRFQGTGTSEGDQVKSSDSVDTFHSSEPVSQSGTYTTVQILSDATNHLSLSIHPLQFWTSLVGVHQ